MLTYKREKEREKERESWYLENRKRLSKTTTNSLKQLSQIEFSLSEAKKLYNCSRIQSKKKNQKPSNSSFSAPDSTVCDFLHFTGDCLVIFTCVFNINGEGLCLITPGFLQTRPSDVHFASVPAEAPQRLSPRSLFYSLDNHGGCFV